jgi:uncharacterized membrane protein (UPF0127 family)
MHRTPKAAPVEDSVPFTLEGNLDFLRANGSVVSTLDIEIADDEAQRTTGLMYRTEMADNRGMLFIFEDITPRNFWMHNTRLPLDIIFVGPDSTIVKVCANAVPMTDEHVPSDLPAKYTVEVNAGYAARMGITAGDRIRWNRSDMNGK